MKTILVLVAAAVGTFGIHGSFAASSRPRITSIQSEGRTIWASGSNARPTLRAGQEVTLDGEGFGLPPDKSLSKVMVGIARALERDLTMYPATTDFIGLLTGQSIYKEDAAPVKLGGEQWPQQWPADILEWEPNRIRFRIPVIATRGPIIVQVQEKTRPVPSLVDSKKPHLVSDVITERLHWAEMDGAPKNYPVYEVGIPRMSEAVDVTVTNDGFADSARRGEAIYWAFDYNLGLPHEMGGINWDDLFAYRVKDPFTGVIVDPKAYFGAIPLVAGEVPEVASRDVRFDPYPMPMPIRGPFAPTLYAGSTRPTGWVGFVQAESIDPLIPGKKPTFKTGFNCAACHSRRITFEDSPGHEVSKVFTGIPNPSWTLKWLASAKIRSMEGLEKKGTGTERADKRALAYALPTGTTEMSLAKSSREKSELYANDDLYSPTAIPIITRHTPVRRALSQSELIAGFEGSYIHAEEGDGAMGPLSAQAIQDLTAYMTTLDENHETLKRIGIYEWLKHKGLLEEIGELAQGHFMKGPSLTSYPALNRRIEAGRRTFDQQCLSCHQANFGTWTDENMMPFASVGTYFSPNRFQLKTGAIRTSILRDLFWVQGRGLLHDGHVRSADADHIDSLEMLVNPDRCREGSPLYNQLYQMSESSFRIPKGKKLQERAIRRHAYFSELPGGTRQQRKFLYWDYQKMRREFGIREAGAAKPTPLPATPHPWCAESAAEVDNLVAYLLTL